jgi:hypothetical protein
VPERWFPRSELDHESFAFTTLFGGVPDDRGPRRIGTDAWFDRAEAADYDIHEETFQVARDQICTVLLFSDPKMLRD